MTLAEKTLYHQIHPVKLLVDWVAGVLSLYFFWQHEPAIALVIALAPPILASAIILHFADLESLKQSAFGRYVAQHMTPAMQAVRFGGYVLAALGAWLNLWWLVVMGLLVVVLGWARGLIGG